MFHISSLLCFQKKSKLVANFRPVCKLYLKMLLFIYISLDVLYAPHQLLGHRRQFMNDI